METVVLGNPKIHRISDYSKFIDIIVKFDPHHRYLGHYCKGSDFYSKLMAQYLNQLHIFTDDSCSEHLFRGTIDMLQAIPFTKITPEFDDDIRYYCRDDDTFVYVSEAFTNDKYDIIGDVISDAIMKLEALGIDIDLYDIMWSHLNDYMFIDPKVIGNEQIVAKAIDCGALTSLKGGLGTPPY